MVNLYTDDTFSADSESSSYSEMQSKMEMLEKKLRKAQKKNKGKKGGNKKLKKDLDALKNEHEQLKMLLRALAMQHKPAAWWHDAFTKSAPKFFDLVSIILDKKLQPRPPVLPTKGFPAIYLSDESDRK